MLNRSVALAIDGWKSDNCHEFLAISACFFDDVFNMCIRTIAITEIDNEKSETITDTLAFVRDKFNLKICSITTDNAINMTKAVKDLIGSNIRCLNHSIQLAINNAIKNSEIINKYINIFESLSKQLRTVVNKSKINITVGTITSTRWNSLYILLNQILQNKEKLLTYADTQSKLYEDNLEKFTSDKEMGIINIVKPKKESILEFIPRRTSTAYIILEKLVEILKPLYELTLILEKRDITIGMAYLQLKKVIYEIKTDYSNVIKEFALKIKANLENRLELLNMDSDYPLLCCLLDPRVKPFIMGGCLGFSDEEYIQAKNKLMELASQTDKIIVADEESLPNKITTDLDRYIMNKHKRRRVIIENEAENYLEYDVVYTTSENISVIWLSLKNTFPVIFGIAKNYLNCMATSSETERVFSEAGRISSLNKSRLSSEHLEQKLIISRNKKL